MHGVKRLFAWMIPRFDAARYNVSLISLRRKDLERAYLDAIAHLPEDEYPSPETRALVLETPPNVVAGSWRQAIAELLKAGGIGNRLRNTYPDFDQRTYGYTTAILQVPVWWAFVPILFSLVLLALASLVTLIENGRVVRHGTHIE